jgi:hypothetical protein
LYVQYSYYAASAKANPISPLVSPLVQKTPDHNYREIIKTEIQSRIDMLVLHVKDMEGRRRVTNSK